MQRESERKLKRARKDKGALETELFSLFEDKKHWTIASLQVKNHICCFTQLLTYIETD